MSRKYIVPTDTTTVGDFKRAYNKAKREGKHYFTICGIEFKTTLAKHLFPMMEDVGIKDEDNLMQVIDRYMNMED